MKQILLQLFLIFFLWISLTSIYNYYKCDDKSILQVIKEIPTSIILRFKECEDKTISIKSDTIYLTKVQTVYLKDTIIVEKHKTNKKLLDSIITKEQRNDLTFKIDTIYKNNNTSTHLKIDGIGYITNLELLNSHIDSTKIITNTITEIKRVHPRGLYLSGEYITSFKKDNALEPMYRVHIDLVSNKFILGTGIGIQNNIPSYTVKVGFRIN